VNAAPAPRAAAAASESVDGGDYIAEKKGGGNVQKNIRTKRKLQPDAGAAGAPAKRVKEAQELEGGSPVKDEDKTIVRVLDGKTVSLKDGR
jgi:hypothetical protein